jgi:hypothetical protein
MPPQTSSRAGSGAAPYDAAPPPFRCARNADGFGSASVQLSGELDLATAPQVEQTVREARLVVLDLRELTFMDCAGMRVIVNAAERPRPDPRLATIAAPVAAPAH